MPFTLTFCTSLLLSIALVPLFIKHSQRLGLIDVPDGIRKVHKVSIPRCGGIAIALATLIPALYFTKAYPNTVFFALSSTIIILFGFLDDRFDLNYRWKLSGQIAASCVALFALPEITRLPFFFDPQSWMVLGYLGLFVFLVATTNAVNLADGLDGLAGGALLLSLALVAYLSWDMQLDQVSVIAIAVIGALLGFLRYNTHPAAVFMGDTGSQFIGFTTALLSILLTQSSGSAMSPVLPLLIVGLPLIDTLMVIGIRTYQGRSPFAPDKNHFHHQLIKFGFQHFEAVAIIYFIQIAFVVLAFFLRYAPDAKILTIYTTIAGGLFSLLYYLNRIGWTFRSAKHLMTDRRNVFLRKLSFLHLYGPYLVLGLLTTTWLYLGLNFEPDASSLPVISILGISLFVILVIVNSDRKLLLLRTTTYLSSALAAYASWTETANSTFPNLVNGLTLATAATLTMSVLVTRREKFRLDNQDILVWALLIGCTVLPLSTQVDMAACEVMIRLVVMIYAVEFLVNCLAGRKLLLQSSGCVTLMLFLLNF